MQRLGFVLFHALAQTVTVAHNLAILKPGVGECRRSKADVDTSIVRCTVYTNFKVMRTFQREMNCSAVSLARHCLSLFRCTFPAACSICSMAGLPSWHFDMDALEHMFSELEDGGGGELSEWSDIQKREMPTTSTGAQGETS